MGVRMSVLSYSQKVVVYFIAISRLLIRCVSSSYHERTKGSENEMATGKYPTKWFWLTPGDSGRLLLTH
jgi:hypothetical protein